MYLFCSKSVHPYIVKLIGACTEPDNLLIVTEKCETDVCSLLREYENIHCNNGFTIVTVLLGTITITIYH